MLHQIGVGALGPVFRTYDPTRDRLIAVKVFRLDITPEQAQALAEQLAHAAQAGLVHPSIVEPLAAGVEGTVAYRAEEYVAAESLDVAMRHYAPASFDTMMRIVGPLAEAIDIARAAGVGHGALHPRDVFVTPDEARASGFGIVDALERLGLRAPVRRPYSAPERVAGADWSTSADVFSLGAIAFELITGRRPSGTGSDTGPLTGAAVANAERLQEVVARAMAESPGDRFPTALAFADALAAAARPVPVVTGSLPFAEMPTPIASDPIGTPSATFAFADEDAVVPSSLADEASAGPAASEEPPALMAGAVPPPSEWEVQRDEIPALALGEAEEVEPQLFDADLDPTPIADPPGTPEDVEAPEAAGDALVFAAADLALSDLRPTTDDSDDNDISFSAGHRLSSEPLEPAVPSLATPSLFERPPDAPPQIVERELFAQASSAAEDGARMDDAESGGARSRAAVLPLAVVLLVGLLIGFGAGYFAAGRNPASPLVAGNDVAAGSPAATEPRAAEPQPVPEGTRGSSKEAVERLAAPAARATPRPPGPAASRSGRLVVRSTPPGAGVTINGKWSGRTPLTRETMPFGDYAVRVLLPGYQTRSEQVSLSADAASRTLSVPLQREVAPVSRAAPVPPAAVPQAAPAAGATPAPTTATATTGALEIDSRPVAARAFVDDRPVGTTPVRVPDLTPGSHTVRLELADHQVWTEVAQVTRGKATRVAGSLEPIR